MSTKHVQTIRCEFQTVTLIETRNHRLFVNNHFAGDRSGHTIHVYPPASALIRRVIDIYAGQHGWDVS
jgi:hypothetical protein